MGLTPDQLGAGFVGLILGLAALGKYLQSLKAAPPVKSADPVLAGIAMAYGDREQTERMIGFLGRCAIALEVLADRRTQEMEDIHRELLDQMRRKEEQEEASPRRQPPRRR